MEVIWSDSKAAREDLLGLVEQYRRLSGVPMALGGIGPTPVKGVG